MVFEELTIHMETIKLTVYTEINLRWITEPNIRVKPISFKKKKKYKRFKENIEQYIHDLEQTKDFLGCRQ